MQSKNTIYVAALEANDWNIAKAYVSVTGRIGIPPLDHAWYPTKGAAGITRDLGTPVLDSDGSVARNAYNLETGKPDPTGSRKRHPERTQHEMAYRMIRTLAGNHRNGAAPEPTPPTTNPVRPEPEPKPTITVSNNADAEWYLRTIWNARDRIREDNAKSVKGGTIPEPGTRSILDAVKAYKLSAVPFMASLASVALDWTPDMRASMGVEDFDLSTLTMPKPGMPDPIEIPKLDVGWHKLAPAVVRQIQARNNVALIGPAGCGKTHLVKQVSDYLELDFADLTMSGGTTRGDLTGVETMSGFKPRSFPGLYGGGGIFFADEMDRANPKLLPVLNSALANGHWTNPATGEMLYKSSNFVFACAMNTLATGADRKYVAAERLDEATLDRIRTSRIRMDYDRDLERRLFDAILAL